MGTREGLWHGGVCAGCGGAFTPGNGPYGRFDFPGEYHKRCLPRHTLVGTSSTPTVEPAPGIVKRAPADHFKAGKLAGLREALVDAEAEDARNDRSSATLFHRLRARIRARITALEEEKES